MLVTIKEILDAPELTDDQKTRYKKAKANAEQCKTNAEKREDVATKLIRTRVGDEYHLAVQETPATDYWNGFLDGLDVRIQFQLDSGRAANDFRDTPVAERFRGFIAGYLLFELRSEPQNQFSPPKVEPPDCSPITY